MESGKPSYWIGLAAAGLCSFYTVSVAAEVWMAAAQMIRPAQHETCCASPADFRANNEIVSTSRKLKKYGLLAVLS